MGLFKSKRLFYAPHSYISFVANDIEQEMKLDGYTIDRQHMANGGFIILISNSNIFKAILGLKTALKIKICPLKDGFYVEAGVGILGQQILPTIIMLLLFWPVIFTQLYGIIKQSNLDDRIIQISNDCVLRHLASASMSSKDDSDIFCPICGKRHSENAKFCSACGEKL